MSETTERTFAEFFAGIGLMRMGLERAGWRIAFANDIDEDKFAMYCEHFGDTGEFVLGDVHKLDAGTIPTVSLATASFPCNDLSLAGARKGLAGEQSSAFWGFIEVLAKMGRRRPPMVLLENVTGFLTSHDGNDFRDALLALNRLGYAVDAFIIDAGRFVPQSRQRLFVVGTRSREVSAINETPGFYESDTRPAALGDFILWNPEINWNIRKLPSLPRQQSKLQDILEDLSPNSAMWWSRERAEYLLNQMSAKHRAEAETMIRGSKTTYGTVFRRVRNGKSMAELRTDGIAGCLRTPRGGSGRQILFGAGRGRFSVRLLTPRECARLMGAGSFIIKAPLNQALFGFGDAVCVPVIEWIARNYLNPVWEEDFAPQSVCKEPQARYVCRKTTRR
jgi:DNA (cytosine-5)-methyltransferase 1